jgi:hypothetical protein
VHGYRVQARRAFSLGPKRDKRRDINPRGDEVSLRTGNLVIPPMPTQHLQPPHQPVQSGSYQDYLSDYDAYCLKYDMYISKVRNLAEQACDPNTKLNKLKARAPKRTPSVSSGTASFVSLSPSDSVSQVSATCHKATFNKAIQAPRSKVDVMVRADPTQDFQSVSKVFPGTYVPTPAETHNFVPRNAEETRRRQAALDLQAKYEWKIVSHRKKDKKSASSDASKSSKTSKASKDSVKSGNKAANEAASYANKLRAAIKTPVVEIAHEPTPPSSEASGVNGLTMLDRLRKSGIDMFAPQRTPTSY